MAGCPLKRGKKGDIPEFVFKNLCIAFESMVRICQLNGKEQETERKKLAMQVNACIGGDLAKNVNTSLMKKLLQETDVDLLYGKTQTAEDRRIKWTTYTHIKMWFDNWARDLLELGFAKKVDGIIVITQDQLKNIINFDETCIYLDGSKNVCGGRPACLFYNPNLPHTGRATGKTSKATTMITKSNALGEAIPPQFQFQTAAKSEENMKMKNDIISCMPQVVGKFSCDKEKSWPCTFGMNEKGGMDDIEFENYFINSIVPLYPHAEDRPGKGSCAWLIVARVGLVRNYWLVYIIWGLFIPWSTKYYRRH